MILLIGLAAAAGPSTLAQPALNPLASLIGHCWEGAAPGNAGIDKHCFEAVFGGEHVRDKHAVRVGGKEIYWGETLYSAEGSKVSFTYYNSTGGVGRGALSADGDILHFTGTVHFDPKAAEEPMNATWSKNASDYAVREGPSGPPRVFRRVD